MFNFITDIKSGIAELHDKLTALEAKVEAIFNHTQPVATAAVEAVTAAETAVEEVKQEVPAVVAEVEQKV